MPYANSHDLRAAFVERLGARTDTVDEADKAALAHANELYKNNFASAEVDEVDRDFAAKEAERRGRYELATGAISAKDLGSRIESLYAEEIEKRKKSRATNASMNQLFRDARKGNNERLERVLNLDKNR